MWTSLSIITFYAKLGITMARYLPVELTLRGRAAVPKSMRESPSNTFNVRHEERRKWVRSS